MSDLQEFFSASVGAAGALIGLLFVAITLAPERIFGEQADSRTHGQAVGAFVALANIFFVSLAALTPRFAAQIIIVAAVVAMWQIIQEGTMMSRQFPDMRGWRRFGLTSLAIYVLELSIAVRILYKVASPNGFVFTVLGLYGYALGTCWSLMRVRDAGKNS